MSGWFFGQLGGWLTDTIVNQAGGCETVSWNRRGVKLPVKCLGCFVGFGLLVLLVGFFPLFLTYLNDGECTHCQVSRISLLAFAHNYNAVG